MVNSRFRKQVNKFEIKCNFCPNFTQQWWYFIRFKLFEKINSFLIVFTLRTYEFVHDLVIYVV